MVKPQIFDLGIVGGPASGKSTVIFNLKEEFGTEGQVVFVPEVSTLLRKGGYPMPSTTSPWNREWQRRFQTAIFKLQLTIEEEYMARAMERKYLKVVRVKDRTLKCGAAYFEGLVKEFCELYGVTEEELNAREHLIFHLESLATASPDDFKKRSECARMEDLTQAQQLELATREIWRSHPHRIPLMGLVGIGTKTDRLIGIIQGILAT